MIGDNMKKKILIIGIILTIIIGFIIIKNLNNDKDGYYVLNKDEIPSIEKILGKRNLYGKNKKRNNKNLIKTYEYNKIDDVYSDLSIYTDYLINDLGFNTTNSFDLNNKSGTIKLASNSIENNYIILMDIKYSKGKYTIKITRGKGRIKVS